MRPPFLTRTGARIAPTAPTSVHALQTNRQPEPGAYIVSDHRPHPDFAVQGVSQAESCFRHSGWAARRLQVFKSLLRTGTRSNRLDRFCNCGSGVWGEVNEAGTDARLRCNTCNDRWCIPCQNTRAKIIVGNVTKLMQGRICRFITFTLRHSNTPLNDQITRLYQSFVKLRHREVWKDNVTGGAAFFEAKLGERDGLWHPHLHVLVEGKFFPHAELSAAWHAVTGDSSIVFIEPVRDREGTASYVTKYVTKPADSSVFAVPDRLDELVCALRGRRLCTTFGSWRGEKLEEVPDDGVKWRALGPLDTLKNRAREGDADAIRWLEVLARKYPLHSWWFRPPDLPPPIDPFA